MMMQGVVKWFANDKGYGFIASGDSQYFVHYKEIAGDGHKNLVQGQKVEFTPMKSEKGMKATSVTVLP